MNAFKSIESLISLVSDLTGVTEILNKYTDLYIYGIPLLNEYDIRFYRYMILHEDIDIVINMDVVKRNFSRLIIESFRKSLNSKKEMTFGQGHLLDRIKSYLPDDVPLIYLWIILCGIAKLIKYRTCYTSWYPHQLYIHTMNKVDISKEDSILFRKFFGREYKNMIRIFLICLGDLLHECPPVNSDEDLNTLLGRIENKLSVSCDDRDTALNFLNKTYIQLLIIMSTKL